MRILAALMLAAVLGAAAPADPRLGLAAVHAIPLEGGGAARLQDAGRGHVVMFWRSDCAPCLIELAHLDSFARAAGSDAVMLVALEPREQALRTLQQRNVSLRHAFVAESAPQTVLASALSGGRRLPYAIALDARGRVCGRHVGLLGTTQAAQWMSQCSR